MKTSNHRPKKPLSFSGTEYINIFIELGFSLAVLLAVFYPIYAKLLSRFDARDSYYSHGYLIPFVAAFLVWRKRNVLRGIPVKGLKSGLALVVIGGFLHLLGLILKINFVSYFMLPVMIMGVVLFLAGKDYAKVLFFPIAFLYLMLPLPAVVISGVSF